MHTASNQIVLRNIYKNFGSINALKDISMATNSGKIHCILGDNGAGKSTLVNIISGVFQPDQGEYTVNEKRNHESHSTRKKLKRWRSERVRNALKLTVESTLIFQLKEKAIYIIPGAM